MISEIREIEQVPVLTEELMAMAKAELNETPDKRSEALAELRQLLEIEKGLRSRMDTAFLLRFLRPAKFDVDRAHKMIKRYYSLRHSTPKVFKNSFTPKDQRDTFSYQLSTVLPKKDAQGRTLFLVRCGAWDTKLVKKEDLFMSTLHMMELSIRDPETLVKGSVVILDMCGLSMSHVLQLSPRDIGNMCSAIQDCFPCRIKAIHVVNQPSVFTHLWNIARLLLSTKMVSRFFVHGHNLQEFHKHVDPQFLPDCLGGPEPLSNEKRVAELMELNEMFFEDGAFGYSDLTKDYVPRGEKKSKK